MNQKHWVCNRLGLPLQNLLPCDKHLCNKVPFFVGHTCANHSRQAYVTTGHDKGVCNRGEGGGAATKQGFDVQPYWYVGVLDFRGLRFRCCRLQQSFLGCWG